MRAAAALEEEEKDMAAKTEQHRVVAQQIESVYAEMAANSAKAAKLVRTLLVQHVYQATFVETHPLLLTRRGRRRRTRPTWSMTSC